MSVAENSSVPTVLNPYRDVAMAYRKKGFFGVLPLPHKQKEAPPSNYTGKIANHPKVEEIEKWIADGKPHNICVRLAGCDDKYELIGIDVDDYFKDGKKKNGGDQLAALEALHGVLPDTWISSARTDGVSGIRWYRVPRGMAFRGKVEKDIECIQKRHRYAVVWPSIHPDGGTYWWYPTGYVPSKENKRIWDSILPLATEFPLLPKAWIDYLSQDGMKMPRDGVIDMDSSVQEVMDWATATFHGDDDTEPCSKMREKLDKHLAKIRNTSTFHDLLTNAHWNIMCLAFEGHHGWNKAIGEINSVFGTVVMDDGNGGAGSTTRDMQTLRGEVFRSYIQGLRKIKGKVVEREEVGAVPIEVSCLKTGMCGAGAQAGDAVQSSQSVQSGISDGGVLPNFRSDDSSAGNCDGDSSDNFDPISDVPRGALKGVPEYETNDDGNAQHFYDTFSSASIGAAFRWVEGYGWIIWHSGVGDVQPHWERDEFGDQQIRRMWYVVKQRQIAYADACYAQFMQLGDDFVKGINNVTEAEVKAARALYQKWQRFAELSGNNRNAENALKAARSLPGVSISVNSLDRNPMLLGVSNGVVELSNDDVRIRDAVATDYIIRNTNVAWEEPTNFAKNTWKEYLSTFLPSEELQRVTQVTLGHMLLGGNPEKIMVVLKGKPNTGKSTMISAITAALGDYAQVVNQSIFQNHKLNPVLARSITARTVVCSEWDENDKLSASQVKRLTGGSDKIQAELKGSNVPVEGVPQFVPLIATNEVPTIQGADKALQNRLYVIPFNIIPQRIRKESANVIETVCRSAVLSWLIEGFVEYRRIGELPLTAEIKEETEDFISQLDEVATFASEQIASATNPEKYVSRTAMYDAFNRWWMENDYRPSDKPSSHLFTRRLSALGYNTPKKALRVNGEVNRYWTGVRLEMKKSNVLSLPNMSDVTVRGSESATDD